jgi:hypothetical protein
MGDNEVYVYVYHQNAGQIQNTVTFLVTTSTEQNYAFWVVHLMGIIPCVLLRAEHLSSAPSLDCWHELS